MYATVWNVLNPSIATLRSAAPSWKATAAADDLMFYNGQPREFSTKRHQGGVFLTLVKSNPNSPLVLEGMANEDGRDAVMIGWISW
jgi:hypothetical protein